ncbi:MAG TPA: hypothetical protein DIV79_01690 [Opitutae bacterium]|mgnify:CR=1 FL=1|nr:hypothetical protein [Opitutaceae bacterium]HCR28714.1 hypothetical protein [Opitutae bacterium]|tara:strand:+ start:286 stop:969 length:684 start_codon:yes stop_codon:yes gene_type:complete
MKPRSLVLLAILLILILIGLSWFRRNVVPKIDEQIQHTPDSEQVETVVGGSQDAIDPLTIFDSEETSEEGTSVASSALAPIPFEHLTVTGLEEVAMIAALQEHSHKFREWKGQIKPSLPELKAHVEREGEDGVLAISLPDGSRVDVTRMRYQSFGTNQGAFTGKILGDTFGEIVLSYVNQAVAGSIRDFRNDNVWKIRNAGDGQQFLALVDVDALGECGVCAEYAQR